MPSADPASQLPRQQTAVVADGPGQCSVHHNVPVSALAADTVLVRTAAVAINPADAKSLDYSAVSNAVIGYDFSGTVVAIGSEAAEQGRLSVGDRVAGAVKGMTSQEPDIGAFSQYVGIAADLLFKIPDSMRFEDAATLGLGVITVTYGLFHDMDLPGSLKRLSQPQEKSDDFVLVAGGSTASGTRAIELLKTAGFRPIATSSPSNFALVQRFGAEKVFDYHDANCAADIRAYTGNELEYALDCITEAETTQLCYSALGRAGGRYVAVEPFRDSIAQSRAHTVRPSWFNAMTVWDHKVELSGEYSRKASVEDRTFSAHAIAAVQALIDRGLVSTHPVKVMPGHWDGVVQGVATIRSQPPSGYKLVYPVV